MRFHLHEDSCHSVTRAVISTSINNYIMIGLWQRHTIEDRSVHGLLEIEHYLSLKENRFVLISEKDGLEKLCSVHESIYVLEII